MHQYSFYFLNIILQRSTRWQRSCIGSVLFIKVIYDRVFACLLGTCAKVSVSSDPHYHKNILHFSRPSNSCPCRWSLSWSFSCLIRLLSSWLQEHQLRQFSINSSPQEPTAVLPASLVQFFLYPVPGKPHPTLSRPSEFPGWFPDAVTKLNLLHHLFNSIVKPFIHLFPESFLHKCL